MIKSDSKDVYNVTKDLSIIVSTKILGSTTVFNIDNQFLEQ